MNAGDRGVPAWKEALRKMQEEAGRAGPGPGKGSTGREYASSYGYRRSEEFSTLPADWDRQSYASLDFETTGLDPRTDRVVEIGLLRFRIDDEGNWREESSMSSLVHPGIPIPAQASNIHGIYDLDVAGAPVFGYFIPELEKIMENCILVAHNAPFDVGFLQAEYARARIAFSGKTILDTVSLARKAYPGKQSYSLGALARILGIHTGTSHRALDDARTCTNLFCRCARQLSA